MSTRQFDSSDDLSNNIRSWQAHILSLYDRKRSAGDGVGDGLLQSAV